MVESVEKGVFRLREHQKEIINHLKRHNVIICHRRFGKTTLAINLLIKGAMTAKHNLWTGAYIAPTYGQAKNVSWRILKSYLPDHPDIKTNEKELKVAFPNGAIIQLLGAQNPDSLRGIGLDMCVLDEVAQMHPKTWSEVISPALADRKGQSIFIGTPKGRNLLYTIWERSSNDVKNWFRKMFKASETKILDADELEGLRKQMSEEEYEQELECSFDAAIGGAYYGKWMNEAEKDNRITKVPYDASLPVHTAWDIGVGDSTAIWFYQSDRGGAVRFIDYYEDTGEGIQYYIKVLQGKPYTYGKMYAPHDITVREWGSDAKTRLQIARENGINFSIISKCGIDEGIQAVRTILPKCWFDREKCEWGIESLKQYRKEFNERMGMFKERPVHDWTSHGADAFRYFAMSYRDKSIRRTRPKKAKTYYKMF